MKPFYFILLIAIATYSYSQNSELHTGNENYRKGDFTSAKSNYKQALKANSKENFDKVYFNLGNTFFNEKLFEQAEKSFDNTISSTNDTLLKASAYYNKGLSLIHMDKPDEAITAFKNTLRLTPNDNDARDNLQKLLNSRRKQNSNKPNPTQNKNNLSANKAEQMLDRLRQKEMELQKKMQKQKISDKKVEKDW